MGWEEQAAAHWEDLCETDEDREEREEQAREDAERRREEREDLERADKQLYGGK